MATDAMTSVKLVQLIAQARQRWEEEDENMGFKYKRAADHLWHRLCCLEYGQGFGVPISPFYLDVYPMFIDAIREELFLGFQEYYRSPGCPDVSILLERLANLKYPEVMPRYFFSAEEKSVMMAEESKKVQFMDDKKVEKRVENKVEVKKKVNMTVEEKVEKHVEIKVEVKKKVNMTVKEKVEKQEEQQDQEKMEFEKDKKKDQIQKEEKKKVVVVVYELKTVSPRINYQKWCIKLPGNKAVQEYMRKEDEEEKKYNKDDKNKEVMNFKEETKKGPAKEIIPRRPNCRKRQKLVARLSEKHTAFKRVDIDLKKESGKVGMGINKEGKKMKKPHYDVKEKIDKFVLTFGGKELPWPERLMVEEGVKKPEAIKKDNKKNKKEITNEKRPVKYWQVVRIQNKKIIGKSEKKVKREEKKKTVHDVLRLRGGASSESDSSEDNDNIRPTLLDPADTEQFTALLNSVMSFAHSGLSHLSKVAWGHMCNGELRNLTGETSEVRAFDTLRQIAGTIQLLENFRSHHRDIGFSLGNKQFIDLLAGLLDLHRLLVAHHQLRQCEISEREKVETPEFNANIVSLIGCCDNFLMKKKIFKETSLLTPCTLSERKRPRSRDSEGPRTKKMLSVPEPSGLVTDPLDDKKPLAEGVRTKTQRAVSESEMLWKCKINSLTSLEELDKLKKSVRANRKDQSHKCPFCGEKFAVNQSRNRHLTSDRCKDVKKIADRLLSIVDHPSSESSDNVSERSSIVNENHPDTEKLIADAQEKINNSRVPHVISRVDPNWRPGKIISRDLWKKLIADANIHTEFCTYIKELLTPYNSLIEDGYSTREPVLAQAYDSQDTQRSFQKNKKEFWAQREAALQEALQEECEEDANLNFSDSEILQPSTSDIELEAKFKAYLTKQPAKKTINTLSGPTVAVYAQSVFSKSVSTSVICYVKKMYPGKKLCDFLFKKHQNTAEFQDHFLTHIVAAAKQSASQASHISAGMQAFIKYMIAVCDKTELEMDDLFNRSRKQDYRRNLEILRGDIVKKLLPLGTCARAEAKARRHREEMAKPGIVVHRNQGYTRYYGCEHFVDLCNQFEEGAKKKEKISRVEFNRMSKWIMWNVIMSEGKRPQLIELLKNKHFFERTRASLAQLKAGYKNIKFDRSKIFEEDDVHVYSVGALDLHERGKTGRVDVMISYSLGVAMECYHIIKEKHFGSDVASDPEAPFFVNYEQDPLSMDGAKKATVVKEICKIMGIRSLNPCDNRHGMASRVLQIGAEGDTGMEQSPDTQRAIYDDYPRHQGVWNKATANQFIREKEKSNRKKKDAEFHQFLQEERERHSKLASKNRIDEALDEILEKELHGIKGRTERHKLMSREKIHFFDLTMSVVMPEWTAYVYLYSSYPRMSSMMESIFTRFLYSDGEGMNIFRTDVANISTLFPDESEGTLIKSVLKLLMSSMRAWNVTRKERDPNSHILFNFKNVEIRYKNQEEEIGRNVLAAKSRVLAGKERDTIIRQAISVAVLKVTESSQESHMTAGSSSGFHDLNEAARCKRLAENIEMRRKLAYQQTEDDEDIDESLITREATEELDS